MVTGLQELISTVVTEQNRRRNVLPEALSLSYFFNKSIPTGLFVDL